MTTLSDDEQSRVRASRSGVADRASRDLRAADTAWQAIDFIATLHESLDAVLAGAAKGSLAPACRPGCSHCCHLRVEVTDVEALRLAHHVDSLEAPAKAARIQRLRTNASAATSSRPEGPHRLPCAFLDGDLCAVYTLRPSACRKAHSLSAQACASLAGELPQNLSLVLQCEVLITGTLEAYTRHQLPAQRYELTDAVLAALNHEQAAQAWFDGRPLIAQQTQQAQQAQQAHRA